MRRKDREVTDITGIEEILLECKTCHIAMFDDDFPYIVPMSYGYKIIDGNTLELYFHSALEGKKLDLMKQNNKVCFSVTHEGDPIHSENLCSSGLYFASVIGFGDAVFVEDPSEKCEALSEVFRRQTGREVAFTIEQAASVCVFKIVSKDFRGKKKIPA